MPAIPVPYLPIPPSPIQGAPQPSILANQSTIHLHIHIPIALQTLLVHSILCDVARMLHSVKAFRSVVFTTILHYLRIDVAHTSRHFVILAPPTPTRTRQYQPTVIAQYCSTFFTTNVEFNLFGQVMSERESFKK